MNKKKLVYILCVCLFVALVAIAAIFLGRYGTQTASGSADGSGFPVYISEIMSANGSYYDDFGNTYDWIELHNRSDIAIDLAGYKLTDNERTVRYTFPAGARIEPDGYYVVHCKRNMAGDYADFSISKAGGEPIVLMNNRSVVIDRIVTLPLSQDEVMARTAGGEWETLAYGTPGFANTQEGYDAYCSARQRETAVRINELMTSNDSYCGPDGRITDWIELYNASQEAFDLSGCRLSDRVDAEGYVFPAGAALGAGEYLLIYCDGGITDSAYAPFSLTSAGGESLSLTTAAGLVLDQLVTPAIPKDSAYARGTDGNWQTAEHPTPGFENSEAGYRAYLAAANGAGAKLRITELMASNVSCLLDAYGQFSDWIELANFGDAAVSLKGYYLSDNPDNSGKWALPDVELAAGGRLVVFASGKDTAENGEPHASFSLNRHKGVVTLRAPSGQMLDSVSYEGLEDDMSYRLDEASGEWQKTEQATPGQTNDDAGYERYMNAMTAGPLVINEVMPGNATLLSQGRGVYCDWIELVNRSDKALNLKDYSLTDNLDKSERTALPDRQLEPGARLVVMCTDTELVRCKYPQINLSLNAENEYIFLVDSGGAVVDRLWLHDIPFGGSCGKMPDKNGQFYFAAPTPDEENADGCRMISSAPVTPAKPGVYESAAAVEVALSAKGTVYYTLDGGTPTEESNVYDGPLSLTKTTVVRAAACEDGKLMSKVVTLDFIINEGHTLPVVSVVTDEKYLYDSRLGIFAGANLFDRTVERPAHITYYNGDESFSTNCGLKLHGAGSRGRLEKKSFKITFRGRYGGVSPLEFPLFEDNDITTFYSILLRNSQDYRRGYVRDELLTWIAYRNTEELFVQDTRYCVLYLNGGYYGLYCIKEAFSSGYFQVHHGVDKETVVVQRGYVTETSEFKLLLNYAADHDMEDPENFQYIADRVNLESLIDWCIYEAYCANVDLSINARYLRSPEYDNNRWHYALFDLDCGFSYPATFDYIMDDLWHGVLFRSLKCNPTFRDMFLKRMAYQLENCLTQEAVLERYEYLIGQIEGEMPREMARWHTERELNYEGHQKTLLRNLTQDRKQQMKEAAAEVFRIPLSEVEAYFTK